MPLYDPYKHAKKLSVIRSSGQGWKAEQLDDGVKYFVLMLEQLGVKTYFSCEGHPDGFYIMFSCSHKMAREIAGASGDFHVELTNSTFVPNANCFCIRLGVVRDYRMVSQKEKDLIIKHAARKWQEAFGPLWILEEAFGK